MRERRLGVAVWVKNTRAAKNLRKFGTIHYISKRLNYVSMYVDANMLDETIRIMEKLHFVTKIERSHRHEIPVEYNNARPDKAKEYDYKQEKNQVMALAETLMAEESSPATVGST
ncbi:YlbG family protein [Brevibacillus agri]|uniref:YlbG family protein n=1 Tax=Brevibacillus TaxID=55080 RepID=UPI00041F2049|nr:MULTISPECIES: YlbG family protein [Brevibacillus]MBY0051488.1 YlbG family protein [Brevibacillus agri]MCG5249835.1 YlbG family protein [Brevibacillus agri]MED1643118.1 YlbG family protein [Brevibacillus agri]MED1656020.1 YlbG family protein [Brevibacillus agri]MED1686155.1 YlbG family protein [Brevibacillus agri]